MAGNLAFWIRSRVALRVRTGHPAGAWSAGLPEPVLWRSAAERRRVGTGHPGGGAWSAGGFQSRSSGDQPRRKDASATRG